MQKKNFIKDNYMVWGILGNLISIAYLVLLLLVKNRAVRLEYNLFGFIITPNALARLVLVGWAYYYSKTGAYGKDIHVFAKDLIGLLVVNIVVTALDESTSLYYLVQAITNLMFMIFITLLINQKKFTVRSKKYANVGFFANIFLCLSIALIVFIVVISFSNYDVYLVTFTAVAHLCLIISMVLTRIIEKKYEAIASGAE